MWRSHWVTRGCRKRGEVSGACNTSASLWRHWAREAQAQILLPERLRPIGGMLDGIVTAGSKSMEQSCNQADRPDMVERQLLRAMRVSAWMIR